MLHADGRFPTPDSEMESSSSDGTDVSPQAENSRRISDPMGDISLSNDESSMTDRSRKAGKFAIQKVKNWGPPDIKPLGPSATGDSPKPTYYNDDADLPHYVNSSRIWEGGQRKGFDISPRMPPLERIMRIGLLRTPFI